MDASFVGIDPGKSGYVAILHSDLMVETIPIPVVGKHYDRVQVWALVCDLKTREVMRVTVEQQQPPYGGASPTVGFKMGMGYEMWLSMLLAAGLSCDIVHPKTWKKRMGATVSPSVKGLARKKALKAKSVEVCQRLFPQVNLLPTGRCRVPSPDMAEAVLIARYGMLYGR